MWWRLNGQDLTGPITRPPYDWRWHSKLVYDGPALVQAVALGPAGQTLAESAPVRFQVSNRGHNLRLIEPNYQRLRTETIRGMAGVRCYSFDSPLWKAEREKGHGQTGSEPFVTGTNRWAGLSAAFNLIGQLEPYNVGPAD